MDKAIEIYSYVLKEYLSTCFANQQDIDPIALNKERFKVKAVFTASMLYLKNNFKTGDSKIVAATNSWLQNYFATENLFSSAIASSNEDLRKLIDEILCDFVGIESIDIPTFYETLLGVESGNEGSGTEISTAKNYRNKLGSYYTPSILAKSVTEKTIDAFFKLNFGIEKMSDAKSLRVEILKEFSAITFADFSCGGWIFLIDIINYFDTLISTLKVDGLAKVDLLKGIALNISAFDVDCLALEVAKLSLLLRIKQPSLYQLFNEKFVHANFLLQSDVEVDEAKKVEIFSSGFIYHDILSLRKIKLKKYDVVLGNPPWEKIRFEEKKFYALYETSISDNHFKSSRINAIDKNELTSPLLAEFSKQFKLEIQKAKSDLKMNSFFNLSNNGELNTYALFTDAAVKLRTKRGVIGLVLKSAIVTSQVNQTLFKFLTKQNLTLAIYDFINRKRIFKIDSRERFCFLLLGTAKSEIFKVVMNLSEVDKIEETRPDIEMSYECLKMLNPYTGMLPNFSNKNEVDFLLRISYDFPFFKNVYADVRFGRIVHLTSHAGFIEKKQSEDNVPIYEGKFFNQFDGKYSGFNGLGDEVRYGNKSSSTLLEDSKKNIKDYFPESRFFINREKWVQLSKNHKEKFMLAWRSLTSATNTRTCIATVLPFIPASQSVQFLTMNHNDLLYLTGLFNSVVFDFILKKKLSGIDLTQSVINQMPVPGIEQITNKVYFNGSLATVKEHISLLVFSLLKNDSRLSPLFEDLGLTNESSSSESRFEIVRKIDLLFMALYRLTDSDVKLVYSEFHKQYSKVDLAWFRTGLKELESNESVSPSSSFVSHFPPNGGMFN